MSKARILSHEERLELTRQKMAARQRYGAWQEYFADTPAYPGAEEHQERLDKNTCPLCGGELTRYEGCYRCKKCGWSKC